MLMRGTLRWDRIRHTIGWLSRRFGLQSRFTARRRSARCVWIDRRRIEQAAINLL